MLDSELIVASARASRSGQSQLSAVEEAEAVTLAMVRQFAPYVIRAQINKRKRVQSSDAGLQPPVCPRLIPSHAIACYGGSYTPLHRNLPIATRHRVAEDATSR
jgi:hypothetical protein